MVHHRIQETCLKTFNRQFVTDRGDLVARRIFDYSFWKS